MTNPLFPAFYRQPQRRAMIKQETKILCIFVQLLMPTYRSRFPRNKQTYGFGCFHLKVSLRWRRQRLSFVKTFRTTNRRVDYVHWHAPRAVRLHYMNWHYFRGSEISALHIVGNIEPDRQQLQKMSYLHVCLFRQRSKRLVFIPVHASNQNSLRWSYRLICLGHLILS